MRVIVAALLVLIRPSFHQFDPASPSENSGVEERYSKNESQHNSCSYAQEKIVRFDSFLPPHEVHADDEKRQPYDARDDTAYRWYLWATVVGVVGAWIGLSLIYRQSQQLKAQIRLQERAQRQWVNTSDWKAGLTTDSDGKFLAVISRLGCVLRFSGGRHNGDVG